MGLNVDMYVYTARIVTPDEVRKWAYRLSSVFGADYFCVPALCLVRFNEFGECIYRHGSADPYFEHELVGIPMPHTYSTNGRIVSVEIATRYYDDGYERGYFPIIYMVSKWLEENLPAENIYYGSDNHYELEKFIPDERERIWKIFSERGNIGHNLGFVINEDVAKSGPVHGIPQCSICDEQYLVRTITDDRTVARVWCPGCGRELKTDDGGASWELMVDKEAEYKRKYGVP